MRKDFEKLQQAVEEMLKISEGKILFEYAAALEHLRTMVRRIYDKHETDGKVSLIEMGKYDRLHKMEKEIEKNLKQLYKKNGRLMDETLKNIFVLTRDTTLQSVAKGVPEKKKSLLAISKKLDIDATVNEKMAGLHWAERMGKHRSDVIYGVNKTLKEGLAQGSTYKELSDRLKKELEGNVVQPMRIIRTESGRVYAKTQQESLDRVADAGIKMVKTWKSSKDERVRSQHQAMEGVTIPYEEEFTFPDGTKTKAPRLSGAPQHDIHCRCFITIDLAEYASDEAHLRLNFFSSRKEKKDHHPERKYSFEGKDLRSVENEIRNLPYEVGVGFKNGKAIFSVHQQGEEAMVNFSEYRRKLRGTDITHNHPDNIPPSPEDLYLLKNRKLNSIRACVSDGVYIIKYDEAVKNLPEFEIFCEDYDKITDKYTKQFLVEVREKGMDPYVAERLMQEASWKELEEKYGVELIFEKLEGE